MSLSHTFPARAAFGPRRRQIDNSSYCGSGRSASTFYWSTVVRRQICLCPLGRWDDGEDCPPNLQLESFLLLEFLCEVDFENHQCGLFSGTFSYFAKIWIFLGKCIVYWPEAKHLSNGFNAQKFVNKNIKTLGKQREPFYFRNFRRKRNHQLNKCTTVIDSFVWNISQEGDMNEKQRRTNILSKWTMHGKCLHCNHITTEKTDKYLITNSIWHPFNLICFRFLGFFHFAGVHLH